MMKTKTFKNGKIELITGPMFAGKSEELIRRLNRLTIAGFKVQVFKPKIDDRYAVNFVYSHNKRKIKAVAVRTARDIIKNLKKDTEAVGIDEVQFLDSAVIDFLNEWADSGKTAIVSGLDLDFKGEAFKFSDKKKTIANLMVIAEKVVKLTAICTYKENGAICGSEATRSQRLINGKPASYKSPLVMVSAFELYEPRCRAHHTVLNKP